MVGEPTAAGGGALLPALSIALEAGKAVFSWSASAPGFVLESTPVLGPSANWENVLTLPALVNGQYVITNDVTTATRFYRLRKP